MMQSLVSSDENRSKSSSILTSDCVQVELHGCSNVLSKDTKVPWPNRDLYRTANYFHQGLFPQNFFMICAKVLM